jgi:hypothetical protein
MAETLEPHVQKAVDDLTRWICTIPAKFDGRENRTFEQIAASAAALILGELKRARTPSPPPAPSDAMVEAAARAYVEDAAEKAVMAGTLTYRGSYREAVGNTVEENWLKYVGEAKKILTAALAEGEKPAPGGRKSLSCTNPWCGSGRLCGHCEAAPSVPDAARRPEQEQKTDDLAENPYEACLRRAVEPFLQWLENRECSAGGVQDVREGLIGVEDVLPDTNIVAGAPLRSAPEDALTFGHLRRLRDAYEGRPVDEPALYAAPTPPTATLCGSAECLATCDESRVHARCPASTPGVSPARVMSIIFDAKQRIIDCEDATNQIIALFNGAPPTAGGWKPDRERVAEKVIKAARNMPRQTPKPGGCSTVHDFQIEAGTVWALDKALTEYDAILSLPSTLEGGGN